MNVSTATTTALLERLEALYTQLEFIPDAFEAPITAELATIDAELAARQQRGE